MKKLIAAAALALGAAACNPLQPTVWGTNPPSQGGSFGVAPAAPACTNPRLCWGHLPTLPRVDVYGDSTAYESQNYITGALAHRANVYLHLNGGTAICDWFTDMTQTAAARPDMVILAFGGNHPRACDHTSDSAQEFQDDAVHASQIFAGIKVVLENGPQASAGGMAPWYGGVPYDTAYQNVAAGQSNVEVAYPAQAVSPNHTFHLQLACMSDESSVQGCVNGEITVRAPDGVHLCPTGYPGNGNACPEYSSGERRYGTAIAQPAVAAFPTQSKASWGVTRVVNVP